MSNSVKGYSLFNDIEDATLRIRNRAVVMANIFEDNLDPSQAKSNKPIIKGAGAALLLKYLSSVSEVEQPQVWDKFKSVMAERGFSYAG